MPLPLKEVLQILLQLSFEADSLQDGRFIAGVSAITEFVEGFTEKMAPYFADILERAQLAVTNLKVISNEVSIVESETRKRGVV